MLLKHCISSSSCLSVIIWAIVIGSSIIIIVVAGRRCCATPLHSFSSFPFVFVFNLIVVPDVIRCPSPSPYSLSSLSLVSSWQLGNRSCDVMWLCCCLCSSTILMLRSSRLPCFCCCCYCCCCCCWKIYDTRVWYQPREEEPTNEHTNELKEVPNQHPCKSLLSTHMSETVTRQ